MKKEVKVILAVLAVLCAAVGLWSSNISVSTFTGSRIHNPDSYVLEAEIMNGTDYHEMTLQEGDVLELSFVSVSGDLKMKITDPDGTEIYQGDGKDVHTSEIVVHNSGIFTIDVKGSKASGSIHIRVRKGNTI
ncbi:MAG: hypothetical protein ACI32N_00515 [Bulleidia sp.]